MKQIALLIACLVPLFGLAQGQREIPAYAVDADGAYIEYSAVISGGKEAIQLGRFLNATDCFNRLGSAFASPEFTGMIRQHPIVQGVCVATRKKA